MADAAALVLRWLLVAILCVAWAVMSLRTARGEELPVCQDVLALQHPRFPVGVLIAEAKGTPFCGGHLDWTFGTDLLPVKRILTDLKPVLWRVHLANGPGLRNGQLGPYEPHQGLSLGGYNALWERGGGRLRKHLEKRARLYCDLFRKHPATRLELSPALEHNLSRKAFLTQARVVKNACPSATVVENPAGGVRATRRFKTERHGTGVAGLQPPCSDSLDGSPATGADVPRFLAASPGCTKFLWEYVYNGRLAEGFVDPRARTAFPTKSQVRELLLLGAFRMKLPPSGCRAVEEPRLFKPWAEDKGRGDPRANKPLWVTPYRGEEVKVLALNAQPVAVLRYYGDFAGGGHRYYSGTGTGQTPAEMIEKAERLSGVPFVVVQEGDRCYGPVYPMWRAGWYRE